MLLGPSFFLIARVKNCTVKVKPSNFISYYLFMFNFEFLKKKKLDLRFNVMFLSQEQRGKDKIQRLKLGQIN